LGIIIIDEEHDDSYKQSDPAPRYNARDVAIMRAQLQNLPVVLGSATPSLESYHNAQTSKFDLLTLPKRIDDRPLPEVTLVDMRHEGGGMFSRPLREKMRERIQKGERIILLQNRRGYAPTVQCGDCGQSIECDHCQVTLTYHANQRQMICHYCAHTERVPTTCPSCNSTNFHMLGVGTQRVEETLEAQFDGVRILRMDMDTTSRKGAHDRILDRFSRGEADILLGTQMVAKGLDFPGVTLVGVISADTGIHLPDFRASERTFQLLTQVSGRAGRGELPGEVVVQTYLPDGEAVQSAQYHDFETFAHKELDARNSLGYPPYGRMTLLLFKGKDENEVARSAGMCAQSLREQSPPDVEIMGPVQAPIARIQRTYRWQVLLKSDSHNRLNTVARQAATQFPPRKSVTLAINVDPVSML
jgi:primosomal protein N' (replication factor Y)